MNKYHVNPDTGRTGVCSAVKSCRFGTAASDHHDTAEAARAAYESSMVDYALPTPMDNEIEQRRRSALAWDTLRDELDIDSARDLYFTMRQRVTLLEAKLKSGDLTSEESKEWHELDHEMDIMRTVWEAKRADQLEHLTYDEVRDRLLEQRQVIKDLSKKIIAGYKANAKAKANKQQDLSSLRVADVEAYHELNALTMVKKRIEKTSSKR